MAEKLLSIETLRALLSYDPETGALTWLERDLSMFRCKFRGAHWNLRFAGKPAFTSLDAYGYPSGRIFNRTFKAHRVAWALANGEWPSQDIDHINGIRSDNRLVNLRCVSRGENLRNRRLSRNNKSGFQGVCFSKHMKRWQAMIYVDGKKMELGFFDNLADAAAARKAAEIAYGYHENHGRAA